MDRWWDDFDKAFDIAVRLEPNDAPEMLVGTALLVLHTIGKAAYDAAAHSFNPSDGFLDAGERIASSQLIGAVCKAFDDASGIPGYGATRVASIKGEADAGARSLATSLRQDNLPWPLVCKRVGETYGLPTNQVVPIRKAMGNGHEFITGLAADRALLKWAAAISKAEATFSKAEKDTFTVDGKERTVHRNEKGEFVSPGSTTSAYMERKKKQTGVKQQKRKRPQEQEQVEEQEEEKESPDWGRSADVKSKQTKEAERQAELAMRSERARRGAIGEAAFQDYLAEQRNIIAEQATAGHRAALGFEASRAAAREAARQGLGQYRGRERQQERQQSIGQAQRPLKIRLREENEPPSAARIVTLFSERDPSMTTKTMMLDTGYTQVPVKVPQMYALDQSPEEVAADHDAVLSMYTGIPEEDLEDRAEYVDERLGNTLAWMDLMDRTGGGLEFLGQDVEAMSRLGNGYLIEDFHNAIDKFYESDEKKSIKDHTEFLDTISFKSSDSNKHEFIRNTIGDVMDHISHEMSTTDFIDAIHRHATDKETVNSLIRALQIREMTATPDQFLPTTSITIQPKGFHMPIWLKNMDTGASGPFVEVLDDNLRSNWGTAIAQMLDDEDNKHVIQGSDYRFEVASMDRDEPHALRMVLNNHGGGSFNDSGVLDASMNVHSGGASTPIRPSSPVKDAVDVRYTGDRPLGAAIPIQVDELRNRLGIEKQPEE